MSKKVKPPVPPMDHKISRPNGYWVPSSQVDVTASWQKAREQMEADQQERAEKVRELKQLGTKK